jgi:aminoglycoside phosphotransferase (APT) family kinase protein
MMSSQSHNNRVNAVALDRIVDALTRAVPEQGGSAPAQVLASGFSSIVVELAGRWVFTVARNPVAASGHALEARLLPALHAWLATPVPSPRWRVHPTVELPFGALGYPKLAGVPLAPERAEAPAIATGIAAFLVELHALPPERALALGVPAPAARRSALEVLRDEEMPLLRDLLTATEHRTIARWWETFLSDRALRAAPACLIHGDLWYENVLVDPAADEVVGVVDFESAAVDDPAQDFATLMHLGPWFVARVAQAYASAGGDPGAGFEHRLRRYWELREMGSVRHAIRHDPAELDDALRKLRVGPVLSPD